MQDRSCDSELWDAFVAVATRHAPTPAISREELSWTFGQLVTEVTKLSKALRSSARAPRIASALPSGPEFFAAQMACLRRGGVFVPLPLGATPREYSHYRRTIPWDTVLCDDARAAEKIRQADAGPVQTYREFRQRGVSIRADIEEDLPPEIRLAQFTSGSTGLPKAILISEANLLANLGQAQGFLRRCEGLAALCPSPQFHAMGNALAFEHLCNGSSIHFANRFDPEEHLERCDGFDCRVLLAPPDYVRMMSHLGLLMANRLSRITDVMLGSARSSATLVAGLQQSQPRVRVHLRYGVSEAVGALARTSLDVGERLRDVQGIGAALPGVELRIKDGELQARASSCARFCQEITTGLRFQLDGEGFLLTGDNATATPSGGISLAGRRGTALKVHGYRVDPCEIETLVSELPEVRSVVALGVNETEGSQEVACCVELQDGTADFPLQRLNAVCRENLALYKRPTSYYHVSRMPRNPAGKPDRAALRELLAAGQLELGGVVREADPV